MDDFSGYHELIRSLDDNFASQADWTTILTCININVPDTKMEKVDSNANFSRLQSVLEQFRVFRLMPISNLLYTAHQFTLLAMLHMSPQVLAAKMLEALSARQLLNVQDTDIELR